ncbi:uncharacterized protein RJT20DRAFT_29607 [Scheffersomyces xylosifermentans]|uniref:uncharacterized protein n=1 Tax=Scheffersomyces xylosifermentans TaxID=1304137 RepID=UPI00315D2B1A
MDASCGPSNALTNLSKHTQRDTSLQNEHFLKNQQGPNGVNNFRQNANVVDNRLNTEFQNFNGGADFASSFMNQYNKPQFQQQQQPQPQQLNYPGWVQDFSGLSLNQTPQNIQNATPQQRNDWHQQFMQQQQQMNIPQSQAQQGQQQFMPNYASGGFHMNMRTNLSTPLYGQQGQTVGGLTEHQEVHKMAEENKLFDDHFDMIEKELNSEQIDKGVVDAKGVPLQEQAPLVNDADKEQFAQTARKVESSMRGLRSEDDQMKSKFENSDFLKLMSSISKRQVELEGDKLVDSATGQDIREELGQSSLQNVRREDIEDTRLNLVPPSSVNYHDPVFDSSAQPINREKETEEQRNRLPDPLAHIKDGELSDILDPFVAAKVISGGQVKTRDWTDNDDDDWLDMTEDRPRPQRRSILTDHWQEVYDDYRHDDDFL